MSQPDDYAEAEALHRRAYQAFDQGRLGEASKLFDALLQLAPQHADYHYMLGLVHKYLRDWPTSLQYNLQALALRSEADESSQWNAGIAATAMGYWNEARRQWQACGIDVPAGDGPIEADFGIVSIRLNPWDSGETLFAQRIDVVRARLLNVPLPTSGYAFDDIVLHDGAKTGERQLDNGQTIPVFNALARLTPSIYRTYAAFIHCEHPDELPPLLQTNLSGIGYAEDWTDSIRSLCLRCSYGVPHQHAQADEAPPWQAARDIGIAAQNQSAVEQLLHDWAAQGQDRRIEAIERREYPLPEPQDGKPWWEAFDNASDT